MIDLTVTSPTSWSSVLALPEVTELRRRRSRVTALMSVLTIALFSGFVVGFAGFPDVLGSVEILDVPLSLWVVLSQFVGTWVLVFCYFRLARTYIQPAADAALAAVSAASESKETAR
ncbi:DUF485 domain-containing protein [Gordonia desulfuricans]|uniref:DUF485 domain-containing protein n=1 Tax=Gordonia desulfuricans TaxID=89051 RepID=A0A7K3LPX9_9ACTN|nr:MULTISPECIES: DUF485 domain-containing protein [Gordonia]EMP11526.1 hypothetical protein ISGA_2505 [Gordonia sp. NB41Y]NDK90310.1 DUF485 domain-containing protein [Gordonia desulfuricans]WLP89570.1 DUF485 domain-containing protein [Gordonia sp. NB41Y]